jgi:hypothetical protein
MPSIGRLEYPEISFSNALDTIERIKSKSIKTVHGLAEELGYSTKSKTPGGTFYYKLVALDKLYGVIERDRGSLSLSSLGQRIAFPLNSSDRSAAVREAILRVELLRSLYKGLGMAYHDSDFRPTLRELTGASPDQIAGEATRIENLYRDALQYLGTDALLTTDKLISEGSPSMGLGPLTTSRPSDTGIPAVSPAPEIPTFKGPPRPVRNLHSEDGYFIRVVLDAEVIQEAIDVLEALKRRTGTKTRASESVGPGGG